MSYSVELNDVTKVEKDLKLSIQRDAFEGRFQKALSKAATQAHLKGYRPGKAPRAMVAKFYGDRLEEDIINEFVREAIKETIDSKNLSLVDVSAYNVDKKVSDEHIQVKLHLSLFPQTDLQIPAGLAAVAEIEEFSEAKVEKQLESFRKMLAEQKDAEENDLLDLLCVINCSYESVVDGEKKEQMSLSSQEVDLDRDDGLPEQVKSQIVGMKSGETKLVTFDFPEDSIDELKGKRAQITFTLNSFKKRVLPEMSDELVTKYGMGESLEDLKKTIRENMQKSLKRNNYEKGSEAVLKAISDSSTVEVPQVLVDAEIREILVRRRIIDKNDKNKNTMSVEHLRPILGETALSSIKGALVYQALVDKYKFKAEEDNIEAMLDNFESLFGDDKVEIKQKTKPENLEREAEHWMLINKLKEVVQLTEKVVATV